MKRYTFEEIEKLVKDATVEVVENGTRSATWLDGEGRAVFEKYYYCDKYRWYEGDLLHQWTIDYPHVNYSYRIWNTNTDRLLMCMLEARGDFWKYMALGLMEDRPLECMMSLDND